MKISIIIVSSSALHNRNMISSFWTFLWHSSYNLNRSRGGFVGGLETSVATVVVPESVTARVGEMVGTLVVGLSDG